MRVAGLLAWLERFFGFGLWLAVSMQTFASCTNSYKYDKPLSAETLGPRRHVRRRCLRRRGVSGGIARGFSHLGSRAATFFLGFREGFRVFGARVLGTVFRALGV